MTREELLFRIPFSRSSRELIIAIAGGISR
jgi:hypothetical protein